MKKIIKTDNAPSPIGPYNQAIIANGVLYTSGQIAIDPTTNELKIENLEEETLLVMENLKAVLAAAELTFDHVVKASIFLSDMNSFSRVNAVYNQYFKEGMAPARETVEVACLPKSVNVEISMIAVKGD